MAMTRSAIQSEEEGLTDYLAAAVWSASSFVVSSVLRSYAQLILSQSRLVGSLLLAATALSPRLMTAGLLAVLPSEVDHLEV